MHISLKLLPRRCCLFLFTGEPKTGVCVCLPNVSRFNFEITSFGLFLFYFFVCTGKHNVHGYNNHNNNATRACFGYHEHSRFGDTDGCYAIIKCRCYVSEIWVEIDPQRSKNIFMSIDISSKKDCFDGNGIVGKFVSYDKLETSI